MTKCHYLCLCLLLVGCTDADWDHAMRYGGLEEDAPPPQTPPAAVSTQAAASAPAPAETSNAEFCNAVATQDAARSGFDPATQARLFAQSYAQCTTINTR